MKKYILILGGFFFFMISCTSEVFELPLQPTPNDTTINICDTLNITYQNNIKLIIDANCASSGCHDANSGSGNFTNFNGLKLKLDNGSFETRVIQQRNMPPSGPLPQNTLDDLKCWIENGYPEN
jgi:hypothetical protein